MTVPRMTIKDQKVGNSPIPGNLHPFPNIIGIILPLISLWNYPGHKSEPRHISRQQSPSAMAHILSVKCFSLNKCTFYLSLCLSLCLSFCDETSRTWASLGSETRSVISVGRPWVLARFKAWPHGFKSQSEINGFICTSKCILFLNCTKIL